MTSILTVPDAMASPQRVPSHLRAVLDLQRAQWDPQGGIRSPLRCGCGHRNFELLHPARKPSQGSGATPWPVEVEGRYFFLLKAACADCGTEHLLLDLDWHGWNAIVHRDERQASLPRPPLQTWSCESCCGRKHGISICLKYPSESEIPGRLWAESWRQFQADAFVSFSLDLTCGHCLRHSHELVHFETK